METLTHLSKLRALGYQSKYHFIEEALSRNMGFISPAEQDRLLDATVAIPGLGGVGGAHLVTLARLGIGRFHLADFDIFEPANVNRQYGAKTSHFGRPKLDVMVAEALNINPYIDIRKFPEGVRSQNLEAFLDGVDVVVDGIDFFNFDVRRMLFNRARDRGIHVVTAGPLGYSAAMLVFAPHRGMGFDAYFNIHDAMRTEEKLLSFMIGLAPRATHRRYIDPRAIDLENHRGPSLGIGCANCASTAATEVVRILLGHKGVRPAPHYFQYDPYARRFHKGYMPFGNRNPLQRLKIAATKRTLANLSRTASPAQPRAPRVTDWGRDIPEAVMDYLLRAAIQAPSGDNCQPWWFRSGKNQIDIMLRPNADHSLFNVNQTASMIACGAALENLLLAASRYGLEGKIAYNASGDAHDCLATIRLQRTNIEENPLQRFIWERHTNRTHYRQAALPMDASIALLQSLDQFPGMELKLYHAREELRTIADLVYQADQVRVTSRSLHEHFMGMIRFTEDEALRERDGFPLKNLEAGWGGEAFLRMTRKWSTMTVLNRLGISRMVALISYRGIRQASLVGLLKCPDTRPETFIKGGRALERLWLTATRKGLAFQPMTAITLFWMRWRMNQLGALGSKQEQMLQSLWETYHRIFDVSPGSPEGHVMLFRIGVGNPVARRTFRKPPEACMLPN
ncbi:MAG: ThiF family adenylyltransferase [Desulfobacterales bacterium]|jgi:molybdopterin/thiamine biosynthesis adenylyltransferase